MNEPWVIGGVGADLAQRLRANAPFVRALLLLAMALEPWMIGLYAAAALLLPRGTRRLPGWSGLLGLGRFGLVWLILFSAGPGLSVNEAFALGPEIWLPLGAVALAALVLFFVAAPETGPELEARAREQVLAALPVLVLAGVVAAGVVLVPGLRWEWGAAMAVVVAGVLVAIGRASVEIATALAAVVVFFAGADVRLDGGVGSERVLPADGSGDVVARRAVGDLVVDLRHVRSGPLRVDASVGVGSLKILLPPQAAVTTRLDVGRGWVSGRSAPRAGVDLHATPSGPGTAGPRFALTVAAEVGIGDLSVSRVDGQYNGPDDL